MSPKYIIKRKFRSIPKSVLIKLFLMFSVGIFLVNIYNNEQRIFESFKRQEEQKNLNKPLEDPFDQNGVFHSKHGTKIYEKEDSVGKIDWHDYTMIAREKLRVGPGEQGNAVKLSKKEEEEHAELRRLSGYNAYAGDKISLARAVPDLRHRDCLRKRYLKELPKVSIIIPFYEEHFSSLIRTVISCLNRAPPELIQEVILVDDGSTHKEFLQKPLDDYIKTTFPDGNVRIIRGKKRVGLIRNRMLGASHAVGEILLFLDCHTEPGPNYLPPLIEPIAMDYRVVTCPFIDVISMDDMSIRAQNEGRRGAFNWRLSYLTLNRLNGDSAHPSEPFDSPVMAGGLFAISKKWFDEIGQYDPGMFIWGGEQFEISFKLWMCGGRMMDIPCSRISHIYRHAMPFAYEFKNPVPTNLKRVAEVWMDDYKEYVYMRDESIKNADAGDLSERKALRERLKCHNFDWFMKNVAFDVIDKNPLIPPESAASGPISISSKSDICIVDGAKEEPITLGPCNKTINLYYSYLGEITDKEGIICLDSSNGKIGDSIKWWNCHKQQGNQLWFINLDVKPIRNPIKIHRSKNDCIGADSTFTKLILLECSKNISENFFLLKWSNIENFDKVLKNWQSQKLQPLPLP